MGILRFVAARAMVTAALALALSASGSLFAQSSPPPPTDFWIFFDSGQFGIRPGDAVILDKVVAAAKQLGRPKIVLTGHTDLTGLHTSDMRLSRWRAEQVEKYLVKGGVPKADITIIAKGDSDPRVATPRGVASQDNRNVHIELK